MKRKVSLSFILENETEYFGFRRQTIVRMNSEQRTSIVSPGDTLTLNLSGDRIFPTVLIRVEEMERAYWEITESVTKAKEYLRTIGISNLSECSMDLETAIMLEKYEEQEKKLGYE